MFYIKSPRLVALRCFHLLIFMSPVLLLYGQKVPEASNAPQLIMGRSKSVLLKEEGTKRREMVTLNQQLLDMLLASNEKVGIDGQLHSNQFIGFNLFANPSDTANATGVIEDAAFSGQTAVFRGSLIDHPESYFQIVIHKKLVGVQVFSSFGIYLIYPNKQGFYLMEEEDPAIDFTEKLFLIVLFPVRSILFPHR